MKTSFRKTGKKKRAFNALFFDELEMVGFSRCFAIFFPFGIRIDIDFFSIFIMSVVSSYIPGFC